ncbi:MAG: SDR family oxidoreductase [bacterium]|nr:SDR family oxidoreductase [bacterium]
MEILKNKKAVITGGSRGIGKAIAVEYLKNGAEVFLLARSADELNETQKELMTLGNVHIATADVSQQDDVERAVNEVAKTFGTIDILVNAAGVYGPIGPVTDVDPREWKKAIDINLFGTFLSVHFFAPLIKNNKSGSIINFVGGGEGAYPNFSSYVSAKGGIARFTETVAEELKDLGMDVNAIAPGAVNTKLLDDLVKVGPEKAGKANYEQALQQKASGGVLPEKVATLCVFLASDKAHGITGKVFSAVWDPYENFPKHKKEIMATDVYTMRRVRPEWRGLDLGERSKQQ